MAIMFFILSKTLPVVIDPVFILFCLFVGMGLRCKMSGRGRLLFLLAMALFYGASAPVVSGPLFTRLEGQRTVTQEKARHFDAAVVLTGMVALKLTQENSEEFESGVDRILKGMDMVRQSQADYLVISGGSGELIESGLSEAKILKDFAIRFGVPEEKVFIEATSRNTRENALMTKVLLETYNLKKAALITSAFHMPRAMGCFRAVGLFPEPIPVDYRVPPADKNDFRRYLPSAGSLELFGSLLHELSGIITYGLLGYADY
jgi:uncharacterized SAM-binding protein YcdF (DUF218 family)